MRLLLKVAAGVLILMVVLSGVGLLLVRSWWRAPLPDTEGTVAESGLRGEVEVIRDVYGVPHIFAGSVYDLRFAQGYVQAQDRWWQMEFARHVGRGAIGELVGRNPSALSSDLFIRTAGWHRAARRTLDAMSSEALAEVQAFSDGINAYILSRPPTELAVEYRVLRLRGIEIEVEPWTPLDSLLFMEVMVWDQTASFGEENFRAALIDSLGEEMTDVYMPPFPYGERPTVVFDEDLPTTAEEARSWLQPPADTAAAKAGVLPWRGPDASMPSFLSGLSGGYASNNWVVSGERTETGMPLLANDPHLGIQMPSIWYEIGLYCEPVGEECPYRVRGFSLPAAPGVILGHNDRIAWGITTNPWDAQDLYRIELNPDNPLQYRLDDRWAEMLVHDEEIRFGDGSEALRLQVRETTWGPILSDNRWNEAAGVATGFDNAAPAAVRWIGHETSRLLEAVIGLNRARDWGEFREALQHWDAISNNFVYADVEGNIGYQTTGRVPVRAPGHTGRIPVDGSSSRNAWKGFVPYQHLPSVLNPRRGFLASANQAPVPLRYYDILRQKLSGSFGNDAHYQFGYSWEAGYRGQRVVELLTATPKHSVQSFREVQGDNKILVAEDLSLYMASLDLGSEQLNQARDWMLRWDFQMDKESGQAALFGFFWKALVHALFKDQLGESGTPGGGDKNMLAVTRLLERPEDPWWDDVSTGDAREKRDDILRRSFAEAYQSAVSRLGSDRDSWQWGAVHTATFRSQPLGASGVGWLESLVNVGPVPVSGGRAIINATAWASAKESFDVVLVPSMRMIVDLGQLSRSRTIHTTGQSGHPASPHHGDLMDDWREIRDHPMFWTREEIEANEESRLVLRPGQR